MVSDPIPLAEISRALVIKLRHHGDVLLASPVFSVLKNRAPHLEIDALVYADTAPMLTQHPAVSQVHGVDRGWKKLGRYARLAAELALLRRLRARRYDLVVHLTEATRGAWLARMLGPRFAVAPRTPGRPQFWPASFTHLYAQPAHARRHTVERHLDALRRLGIQPGEDERGLTLVPGEPAETRVEGLLARHALAAQDFIHVHPGSRWLFKCWTAEKNAELIRRLHEAGRRVVLTGAPEAREGAFVEAIVAQAGVPVVNLAGQLSLKELAALTARAALFVGVDSAPMHIAAAMGTPVVALFGPSGDLEWGPWRVPHRLIVSQAHGCRPCGLDGCGGGKVSDCLVTVPVAPVLEAIAALSAGR